MSGFSNTVLGGMSKLIRQAIQSPNYVAGLTGWSINKIGTAEFNQLTLRGNFIGPDYFISNGDGTLTNDAGFFLYSGTPAVGNLVYAESANGGHDKFNNNFIAGTLVLNNTFHTAILIDGVNVNYYTFTAQPSALFTLIANANLVIGPPNWLSITTDTWHNMTLLSSWANVAGNTVARYRKIPAPANCVQVQGVLDATAATASKFFTLPSGGIGYIPSGNGGYAVGANGSVPAGQSPQMRWDNAGNLTIASFGVPSASAVWITGIIPLDA